MSETVSKLETEKAETTAKLICVQSENDRMKQELIQLKVIFEIANLKSIIKWLTIIMYTQQLIVLLPSFSDKNK